MNIIKTCAVGVASFGLVLGTFASRPVFAIPANGISAIQAQGIKGGTPVLKLNEDYPISISFLEMGEIIKQAWYGSNADLEATYDSTEGKSRVLFLSPTSGSKFNGTALTIQTQPDNGGPVRLYSFILKEGKPSRTAFAIYPDSASLESAIAVDKNKIKLSDHPSMVQALPVLKAEQEFEATVDTPVVSSSSTNFRDTEDNFRDTEDYQESSQQTRLKQANALIRGLLYARNQKITKYRYRGSNHNRVNGIVNKLRRGSTLVSAAKRYNVPISVINELLQLGNYQSLPSLASTP